MASKLRVDEIRDADGTGPVSVPEGITVSGKVLQHKVQNKASGTAGDATYSNQSVANFSGLDSGKYYRLTWGFELDEKSGSNNLATLELRQTTAGGTLLRTLEKKVLPASQDNGLSGSAIFTGVSGTVHISVSTAGTAALAGGFTGASVTIEEISIATVSTDFT